jgi:periplasmic divalent cation tolerance protein
LANSTRRPRRGARSRAQIAPARAVRVVLSTSSKMDAPKIATALVTGGFAACVNVLPGALSVYRWRGKLVRARESLLVIKTTSRRLSACLARLVEVHGHEVPEALVLTPGTGLAAYLDWVVKTTRERRT